MESLLERGLEMLERTSRTFFIPIQRLPSGLIEAVGSAYLCLRAIDEIEDHPTLDCETKERLLRNISQTLQASTDGIHTDDLLLNTDGYHEYLAEVSLQLSRLGSPGSA